MTLAKSLYSLDYSKSINRVDLYDFLRGLAMLLVMMQHAVIPGWQYLCVFHMPIFFFMSGMVSGDKRMPSFGSYAWIRFKRLMIPYFVFGVFDVLMHTLLDAFYLHHDYNFLYGIFGLLTGQFEPGDGVGIYWFLFTMYVADLLIYPIKKYASKQVFLIVGGALLFILLSYGSTHWFNITFFTIDKAFMAAAFILIGYLCRSFAHYITDLKCRWWEFVLFVLGCLGVVLSKLYNPQIVLMYINQYGHYCLFFVGALSGIIAFLILGKYLYMLMYKRKHLAYCLLMWMGYNSLVLFPVHLEVKTYLGGAYMKLGVGSWYWLIVLFSMFVLSIPICNLITQYAPWILGNFSKKQLNRV